MELADALQTNEAAFDEKFRDKELTVTGQIARIRREGDTYVMTLTVVEPPVVARFDLEHRAVLAKLQSGQAVTIRGVVTSGIYPKDGGRLQVHILKSTVVRDKDQ
jgi:hypothetical protein